MSESIVVGLAVGGGVAVIGALIGHFLRLRETTIQWDREKERMGALWLREKEEREILWAEQERRRKSDRRRELYERDLSIVRDLVDSLMETVDRMEWSAYAEADVGRGARAELGREAHLMAGKANVVTLSMEHQELQESFTRLMDVYGHWIDLLDLGTGKAKLGKEEEFKQLRDEVRTIASEAMRGTREILEEV